MDVAAADANWDVLLHLSSHRAVVSAINQVGLCVDDFHKPLGIESGRASVAATRWRDAARDPKQLKNAGAEAGRKALVIVGVVAATVLTAGLAKNATKTND